MKSQVVVINSSPNMEAGNTALILAPFVEGLQSAGSAVDIFYTRRLHIKPCLGEFHCWFKTPGKCFQQDDMQLLLPKLAAADILVLATPLYVDGVSGPLKNLLDRVLPIGQPLIELRGGHCRHPARPGVKSGSLVLVANCGFWETDNFDPLLAHIQAVCRNLGRTFKGALLRPHGPALKAMLDLGAPVDDVLSAAREAGRQLATTGEMAPELLRTVGRELLPQQQYVEIVNQRIRKTLEALENKPKPGRDRDGSDRRP